MLNNVLTRTKDEQNWLEIIQKTMYIQLAITRDWLLEPQSNIARHNGLTILYQLVREQ